MAEAPSRGETSTAPVTLEDVQRLLTKQLGDSHIQPRGLSGGLIADRAFRDSRDEQCRIISHLVGGIQVLDVAHDLGFVPGYCRFFGAHAPVGAPPPHVTVAYVDYHRWSSSNVRVEIQNQGAGGLDNVQVILMIGGRRE